MSKIGNHRIEIQETDAYRFGWESAERGERRPDWETCAIGDLETLRAALLGYEDYHNQERSL
jgi:hypothetical protein